MSIHKFDDLDPKAKAIFRENDMDYEEMLWFQYRLMASSDLEAVESYKDAYWNYVFERDERDKKYGTY